MPFALRSATVFSAAPVLEHCCGMLFANALSPITWIGTLEAFLVPSSTSAVRSGPHVKPSWNCAHSTIGAPPDVVCCGSERFTTLDTSRRPTDPVSTSTLPIVWHDDDPGTHTCTLVNRPLM